MSSGIESKIEYHGYFSSFLTDELYERTVVIRDKRDRERFCMDNFVPLPAKPYLDQIDLNKHSIIICCRGTRDSGVFYGIDKIKLSAHSIYINIQKIQANIPCQGADLDCKCFIITVPVSALKGEGGPGRFIPTNLKVKDVWVDVTAQPEFLGFNYDRNNEDFNQSTSIAEMFSPNILVKTDLLERKKRYEEFVQRVNLVLKRVLGVYLGGISEGNVTPYHVARRSLSFS